MRGWAACIDSPPERTLYVRMCPLVSGDCMSHGERAYLHGQRRKERERREAIERGACRCKKIGDAKMRFAKKGPPRP